MKIVSFFSEHSLFAVGTVQCIDHGKKNGLADGLGVSLTFCKESTSKDSKLIYLLKVASQFWKKLSSRGF